MSLRVAGAVALAMSIGALLSSHASAQEPVCTAPTGAPRLDHVILVVRDLDSAGASFARHGFRLKLGRLHANNLLNRHVKFRDDTSIELMTVRGEPGDSMAIRYADLLRAGEGGVYAALDAAELGPVASAVFALGIPSVHGSSGRWRFLSFPQSAPTGAVFFGSGGFAANDPDSLVTHVPPITGLREAWVEGGDALSDLLAGVGARRCGIVRSQAGDTGVRWALSRGAIVVLPAQPGARPRVRGVVLGARLAEARLVRPHPEVWLLYRPEIQAR